MSRPRYDFRTPRSTSLTGIELRNFKSIKSAQIHTKPLTVVSGSNSSGKSTLLQAVLALAQNSKQRIDGRRFPLNGEYGRLGTFWSLLSQKLDRYQYMTIALQFETDRGDVLRNAGPRFRSNRKKREDLENSEVERVTGYWSLGFDGRFENLSGSAQIGTIRTCAKGSFWTIKLDLERDTLGYDPSELGVGGFEYDGDFDNFSGQLTIELDRHGELDIDQHLDLSIPIDQAKVSSGQCSSLFVPFFEPSQQVEKWFKEVTRQAHDTHTDAEDDHQYIQDHDHFVQLAIEGIVRRDPPDKYPELVRWYKDLDSTDKGWIEDRTAELLQLICDIFDDDMMQPLVGAQRAFSRYLASRVSYVGPLRHAPHLPFGSASDPDSGHVGVSGEHVAAILQAKLSEKNRYPLPDDHETEVTLEEAVNQWLRFFELADSLAVDEKTPLVYNIEIVPPGLDEPVPLNAVGVGVSQLLPVIVQCLVAGPGALVILEQPELHLHPAAQQRLADFLIACTNWGQRILVETHSEYMVLRLRRRIAEDDSDELLERVAILFAERDDQGDTNFRDVKLNEVGGVLDWPKGFFDQGPNEAHQLLIAAAERQRRDEEAAKSQRS
ncbi:DUF3696 domain-containing protein [Candidatus Poriferisocius sp.]|uniref:DUF3696 domain-containing protein n=1 Tax=Candidatus Poriferisocius sp. TaxID=3101276 RepID=UPI003B0194A4